MKSKKRFLGLLCFMSLLLMPLAANASGNIESQTWALERTIDGFTVPVALTIDNAGNIYVSNWGGDTVTRVDQNGMRSTFISGIQSPAGSAFDPEGNFYVASYAEGVVYRIDPSGSKSILTRGLHTPTGLTLYSGGGLLVTNRNIGELVKVERDGTNRVLRAGFDTAAGVLEGPNGEIYVANFNGGVSKLTVGASGSIEHQTISNAFRHPAIGMFLDGEDLYVVDHGEGAVKKISPNGGAETVATGIPSAVGMLRLPDGRVIVTSWGGKLFVFRTPFEKTTGASDMRQYPRLTLDNTVSDLMRHPAFEGFAPHLLSKESDVSNVDIQLRNAALLVRYHSYVDPDTVVTSLNRMVEDAESGRKIFYDFYDEQEKKRDPSKKATGLFFYRGKPGAPFAVVCPGGGFSYVGSLHEGFPYALEISKEGYNAFVLQYRVGGGGLPATEDLAAALSYIFENAETLGIAKEGYSLWGSSAGARMVANVGSEGSVAFGGAVLPKPAAVIMAYTGHSAFKKSDPPTFVIASENDRIVNISVVEKRVDEMRKAGVEVEYQRYKNAGHGFGLGIGMEVEGWIANAISFWKKYIK